MLALILFHMKAGVRVAVQSFAPLYCAGVAWVLLQMYPVEMVRQIARSLFGGSPVHVLAFGTLAFVLPVVAASRLATGLNGWLRHLPVSGSGNRTGLALALGVVQIPPAVVCVLLALVARSQQVPVAGAAGRLALLLAAGAVAALPVRRRFLTAPLCVIAAGLVLFGRFGYVAAGTGLIAAAVWLAGSIREPKAPRQWSGAGALLWSRILWRALGLHLPAAWAAGLATIGLTLLFVTNNPLPGWLRTRSTAFGGAMSVAIFLAGAAYQIAVRRPVWPWARSLPWSSRDRILSDGIFLALHALPLVLPAILIDPAGALVAALTVPLLALRAAGHIRRIPERRSGIVPLLAEGFAVAGAGALLPWAAPLWPAAVPLVLRAAARAETRQKVTRWLELHHTSTGDSLSWSGR